MKKFDWRMDFYAPLRPLLFTLPPETAQKIALAGLRLRPVARPALPPVLASTLAGLAFPSPIGLAAGLDKNLTCLAPLLSLGFGFLEAGTITPLARKGHLSPRLWRRVQEEAIINRMGMPNQGMEAAALRLSRFRAAEARAGQSPAIIGINLAPQEAAVDAKIWRRDLVVLAQKFSRHASYLSINLSSPNMAGLRSLQQAGPLRGLLEALAALDLPPVMLKLSPDLDEAALTALLAATRQGKIAALIMGNSTTGPGAPAGARRGIDSGGLSGLPLRALARRQLALLFRLSGGTIPLISVGGIDSGAEAYARIRAGASLVQIYTGLIFHGPALVQQMNRQLAALLARDKFPDLTAAIGADEKQGQSSGKEDCKSLLKSEGKQNEYPAIDFERPVASPRPAFAAHERQGHD